MADSINLNNTSPTVFKPTLAPVTSHLTTSNPPTLGVGAVHPSIATHPATQAAVNGLTVKKA